MNSVSNFDSTSTLALSSGLLNEWDFTVIIFYLLFTLSIGYICKAVAKNGSDFFRGGGNMLWWMKHYRQVWLA